MKSLDAPTNSSKLVTDSEEFQRLIDSAPPMGDDPQIHALYVIADSIRRSVKALTVSQYVLMAVLLIHALMVGKW